MLRYQKEWESLGINNYYAATAPTGEWASLPQLIGRQSADVGIIGAGFAGLSAGIELAKRGYRVTILDAKALGFGASARNGGQVLVGFACGQSYLERHLGLTQAKMLWALSLDAVNLIGERCAQYSINADWVRGYYYAGVKPSSIASMQKEAEAMQKRYGFTQTWIDPQSIRAHIDSPRYVCALHERVSGHIHPLKYQLGLAKAAIKEGCTIHPESPVETLTLGTQNQKHCIKTAAGELHCDFVVLAGNALLGNIAPQVTALHQRILPVGTYIGASAVLPRALAERLIADNACVCDNQFVLDYFRLSADHRLLFGGRVNYTSRLPHNLPQVMHQGMTRVFPQLATVSMDYAWGGYVDITRSRAPDFGRIAKTVYYLQGFSGHGVALTGMAGALVASAIAGQAERFDVFAGLPKQNFPGGDFLRIPTYALGMLYFRLRDLI